MTKFIDEKIEVRYDKKKCIPISFTWKEKEYIIKEIIRMCQDWGFPSSAPSRKNWRMRRHRNYYLVRTESDEIYEIYLDRSEKKRTWILYMKK